MDPTKSEITPFEVRRIHLALLVCFFLSGATGLVYEVVWTRMAGLVFGNTVYAVTTVLAAFFSGLALGSYLLGPVADRAKRHVHLYGLMEIGIGLYGLCTPLLFRLVENIYLTSYQLGRENLLFFTLFQFLLVFTILVAPTTLMGGTLPILSRYFVRRQTEIGYGVGAIYALNTAGAVVGTISAGFFLLPVMGVRDAIWMTATLNLGIGLLSIVFSRRLPELGVEGIVRRPGQLAEAWGEHRVHVGKVHLRLTALVALMFAISGGASMIYEIAWTRALALVLGSSVYAFTTMLATFLIGLAGGSYAFSRFFRHKEELGPESFGWLEICIGISSLLILPFFDQLPNLFLRLAGLVNFSFGGLQVVQFAISFFVMIIPTLLIGATFPCVVKICTRNIQHLGGNIGTLYAINTFGSIIGSLLGGFFFIPWMGAQNALTLAVSLNLVIGAVLVSLSWMKGRAWRARMVAATACAAFILALLIPRWDPHLMASGVAIYGQKYLAAATGLSLNEMARQGDLLFFKEGLNATISVHQVGKKRILKTNGKTDAGNARDMHTQLMSGHLPLFLHPGPKEVLIIGLGSGVTAGAVARHPVKALEVVEIEPAVVEAAAFFSAENRGVLEDPRLRIVIGDGRNFLLSTPKVYDVIISEPSNPWIAGVANLFTLEFYRAARARLRAGGIMCQWLQTYGIKPSDLRMVIRTFQTVFPHTTIWQTIPGDLLLIGTEGPLVVDLGRRQQAWALPEVMEDLRTLGFEAPEAVLADFVLGEKDARLFAQHAELNTDDLPLLEFSAPTSLYLRTIDQNKALVHSYRDYEFPPVTGVEPRFLSSADFRFQLGKVQLVKGDRQEALRHLNLALANNPRHLLSLLLRAELQLQNGLPLQALADLQMALEVEPHNAGVLYNMGVVYYRQRIPERAEEYLRKALAVREEFAEAHYLLGELLMAEGQAEPARRAYQRAAELRPDAASFWARLGQALLALDTPSQAIQAYSKAIAVDTHDAGLYLGLARALDQAGKDEEAFRYYGEAIGQKPRLSAAYIGRAKYYLRRQERQRAIRELVQGVTVNPGDVSLLRYLDQVVAEGL
ncbi:MAG: fused MFS/spermidine synthase [Candidatus Methylomirabilales bacterium]